MYNITMAVCRCDLLKWWRTVQDLCHSWELLGNPDRPIILWFKLGKYWSHGPQWQASRPEIEGNGLLCRVKKEDRWRRAKYTILTIKLHNTLGGNIDINSQLSHLELLNALLSLKDCLVGLSIHRLNAGAPHPSK